MFVIGMEALDDCSNNNSVKTHESKELGQPAVACMVLHRQVWQLVQQVEPQSKDSPLWLSMGEDPHSDSLLGFAEVAALFAVSWQAARETRKHRRPPSVCVSWC